MKGFGFVMDLTTGNQRKWYAGDDGVQRWADNDEPLDIPRPVEPMEECECSLRIRLVGDGCHACNPEYAKQFEESE